jgi:outer membrane protein assembly factor BamB
VVPPWYAGQCPLVDGDAVVLGVGGTEALLMSVGLDKGEVRWKTPNPKGWKMTHSSVVPMEGEGTRMYVYCAHAGVVGVAAKDGALLWETPDWKISIATVPTPVPVGGDRVFLTGGYNAGSLMLKVRRVADKFVAVTEWRVGPEVFGATQQTPILHDGRLYGVRADGKFVCLSLDGKVQWASTASQTFGLGSYVLGGGVMFAVTDNGMLRLLAASPDKYEALGQAQVLKGREAWGPMALVNGRLLLRDLTRLICLDVAAH